ncbi:hypothetical protein MKW94_005224 [Papaver nudicaule]|uniref:Uncharacterized protein n=1 Tax=Papaver nudicaule TaxID=74823 RepID=A0AA41VBU8_PAPNU|nr:hypothetical protein [Papaver nudicaule]
MLARKRLVESLLKNPLKNQFASFCTTTTEKVKSKTFLRKVVPFLLFSLTGGVALSAVNDLAIYGGCSSKALEKASQCQAVLEALGEPIERGPWYNASLAVAHNRSSVSCTFPVTGSRGTGIFQLKAVRPGDDALLPVLFPFLRRQNWEILMMEALIHIPSNEEKNQTLRINLSDAAASAITYPGNKPPGCTRSQDPSTLES